MTKPTKTKDWKKEFDEIFQYDKEYKYEDKSEGFVIKADEETIKQFISSLIKSQKEEIKNSVENMPWVLARDPAHQVEYGFRRPRRKVIDRNEVLKAIEKL